MKKKLSLATWNVRTLLDTNDAERPQRQTALVARELDRYNIDIAALQETRLEGQGELKSIRYYIDYSQASLTIMETSARMLCVILAYGVH